MTVKKIKNYSLTDLKYSRYCNYSQTVMDRYRILFNHPATEPNQPFNGVIQSEEQFQSILTELRVIRDPELEVFAEKIDKKWINRQGGVAAMADVTTVFEQYYQVDVTTWNPDLVRSYGDEFITWIMTTQKDYITRFAGIQLEEKHPRQLYNRYKGDHKSSRGIDGPGDRRDKGAIIFALREENAHPMMLAPTFANVRFKDSKLRGIHNDAFSNYFREARYLGVSMDFISSLPWVDTDSDAKRAQTVATCRAEMAYWADFKGMDFHMISKADQHVFTSVAQCLGYSTTSTEVKNMVAFVEELAHQELIVGDELWCGESSKKSGLYPTHDPENWLTGNILYCAVQKWSLEVNGYKLIFEPKPVRLKAKHAFMKTNGDDSYLLLGDKYTDKQMLRLAQIHAEVAAAFNQIIEVSKAGWSDCHLEYCKRVFTLRLGSKGYVNASHKDGFVYPISKYSVEKAVNAIYHPENIPTFPNKKDLVIWVCSIMDCAYGTRGWKLAVALIVRGNPDLFADIESLTISSETMALLKEDYWFREFAGDWDLPNSHTFQYIRTLISK